MKRVNLAPKTFHVFNKTLPTGRPDHPMLDSFLRTYRAKHGIESVQVKADNALWPLKAARAWTAQLPMRNPLKNQPIRS
jgi:hypothetical protein